MNQVDQLREMVATMLMLPPDQVGSETSLAGLDTSLRVASLKLGLRRLGLSLPTAFSPSTYRELEAAVFGKDSAKPSMAPSGGENYTTMVRTHAPLAGVQVGIDVQDIQSLPVADDYWEHEFYAGMFDKSEIAYAVVQSKPRIHLAACWCAKEALRKCDPSFIKVGFESTMVAHEQDGRPYMQWQSPSGPVRLPHAVSLSHTGELASAVVVAIAFPSELRRPDARTPAPPMEAAEPPRPGESPHRWTGIFFTSVGLIVFAILALLLFRFIR